MSADMTTNLSDVDRLYVESLFISPVRCDWSEGYGETWRYIAAPNCPHCGEYCRWVEGEEVGDAVGYESWRCMHKGCDNYGQEVESEGDDGPMMSYYYPLHVESFSSKSGYDESDAEKIGHLPICIIHFEDQDTYALALSGGGMDLSWEICEAFMCLGYLPPMHFCDLPHMSGYPRDDRHRWVMAGCKRSAEVAKLRADRIIENIDKMEGKS